MSRSAKNLAKLLAVTGAALALTALGLRYTARTVTNGANLKVYAEMSLFLASSLILIALLIQWWEKNQLRLYIARDIKTVFWSSTILFVAVLSFIVINSAVWNSRQRIINKFHRLYHAAGGFKSFYLGIQSAQYPADSWVMQEIISELKPDFVIETGTAKGGTALFYADVLEKVNKDGKVITVDIDPYDPKVSHFKNWRERVIFLQGSSVAPEVFGVIAKQVQRHTAIVTLDSLHWKPHVLKELELYSKLVPVNSYIIVQDTQFTGHPIPGGSEGPWEAVQEFLKTNKNFVADHTRERHLITANPSGYLKRVR